MKTKAIITVCLFILTLVSCTPASNRVTPTPMVIPATTKASDTPAPFTATQTAEESNSLVKQECLNTNSDVTIIQQIAKVGSVIGVENETSSPVILNLETGTHNAVPLQNKGSVPIMHVSPNGNYLAYVEDLENASGTIEKQVVWVVDSNGNTLASQSINPEIIFTEWRWLDDERLEFNFQSLTPKDGTVVIFYPFQNKWQNLSQSLPDFYKYFDLDQPEWLVDYSPDLKQVIYLGEVSEFVIGPKLFDVNSQRIVWQVTDASAWIKVPKWSPIDDKLAIMSGDSIYIVSRDRNATTSPRLGDNFEIMGITWSPNGKYIAMLVRHNLPIPIGYIMLYDIHKNSIIDYCIKSDNLSGVRPPVWSVDSKFIFFQLTTNYNDGPRISPIIIDVMNDNLFQLSGGIEPLAWMNSNP